MFSHSFNIAAALAAVFTAVFLIPRFTGIFQDMLGPAPLPALTSFVLRSQPLWVGLGFAFLLVAVYLAWHHRLQAPPASASIVLLLLASAQVGLIIVALFLALIVTIKVQGPVP